MQRPLRRPGLLGGGGGGGGSSSVLHLLVLLLVLLLVILLLPPSKPFGGGGRVVVTAAMDTIPREYNEEDDRTHRVVVPATKVECETTVGMLQLVIIEQWSPHGARHFLHLVQNDYYHGCALHRAVDGFLVQFGISPNTTLRERYADQTIPDDTTVDDTTTTTTTSSSSSSSHHHHHHHPHGSRSSIPFEPGFLSFAGNGPNSRTTEVFIVMPNANDDTLEHFGIDNNPWETPIGFVTPTSLEQVVTNINTQYGDMPPWGTGPDPQRMYDTDGYNQYLPTNYPDLTYIKTCRIVGTTQVQEEYYDIDDDENEEEEEYDEEEEL